MVPRDRMAQPVTGQRSTPVQRFATLVGRQRIWAVSAIHAEVRRLEAIHDVIEKRLEPRDGLVYLGNMIGSGAAVYDTVAELLAFRRAFIARPAAFAADLVYLRGSQEEMWQKLLELQFAPNPVEVLGWMLDHGVGATISAYGADPKHGLAAAREGPVAVTRWTNALRQSVNSAPGHANLLTALRRAAFTGNNELLFVHAGIDPSRPLTAQHDSFWWGGAGFLDLAQPYAGFRKIIRGFDRHHGGLQASPFAVSVDRGCGTGGPLACACFDLDGAVIESFEA
jgi:serine/threonine protein phosphatase 1